MTAAGGAGRGDGTPGGAQEGSGGRGGRAGPGGGGDEGRGRTGGAASRGGTEHDGDPRGAGAGRPALSVAMIARDEEDAVGRALDSVAWADERLVLDSGSRDRTPEVARGRGARVVETDWPGYGPQRARALEAAAGPWVLALDADEVVTPALGREIRRLLAEGPRAAGYRIPFHTRYLDRWLGRSGWHRERHLRLVRKDAATVTPSRVHERIEVDGEVGRLEEPILHRSYRDVAHHARKIAEYARLKAEEKHRRGERTTLAGALGHGAAAFLSGYVLRGRFLDGGAGLIFELMSGWAALLAYVRLWEMQRGPSEEGPVP